MHAQAPEARAALDAFRDSLGTVSDTAALAALEDSKIEVAKARRDSALLHLELGFLAYRLGELTGAKQHFDDAGSEFEWTIDLEPEWPYGWYGLGLAELAIGEHPVIALENIRQALGRDFLSKAARAFARAAELDPSFAAPVVDLAETALTQRVRSRLEVALEAVRAAAATAAGARPELQRGRGRVELAVGEGDSALAAFQRYLEVGGDSGVGQLEIARTLFFLKRAEPAREAYDRGVASGPSADAVALYRSDLAWIATRDELAEFDATLPERLGAWLRAFWRERDVEDLRRPGERLEEHYRRYFYARRHYRLVSRHRRYDIINPFRTAQNQFDDRGLMYLRHGEPSRRVVFNAIGVDANESWTYERPGGDLIFHFVARGDVTDYKLVESVLDVFGLDTALMIQTGAMDLGIARALFESRIPIHDRYQRLASLSRSNAGPVLAEERRAGDRAIERGTSTDAYAHGFARSLSPVVQQYAFADSAGRGRVTLVFAIPGPALQAERRGAQTVYPLELRVGALRADGTAAGYLDTTHAYRTDGQLQRGQYLSGYVELEVAAERLAVRALVAQPWYDAGDVVRADSVIVPDLAAGTLALSDLVAGYEGSGLTWIRAGDTIPLNPQQTYASGAALTLYYEVYGLTTGEPYHTRVEVWKEGGGGVFGLVRRLFGGGGPPVSLAFDRRAAGPLDRRRHDVDLSALEPGRYRLELRVQRGDEDPIVRRITMEIR